MFSFPPYTKHQVNLQFKDILILQLYDFLPPYCTGVVGCSVRSSLVVAGEESELQEGSVKISELVDDVDCCDVGADVAAVDVAMLVVTVHGVDAVLVEALAFDAVGVDVVGISTIDFGVAGDDGGGVDGGGVDGGGVDGGGVDRECVDRVDDVEDVYSMSTGVVIGSVHGGVCLVKASIEAK